jgi:hypothetical protein
MLATRTIVGLTGLAILAAFTVASADVQALHQKTARAAACPALPSVTWWDTSHRKIITYVDQKFQGDWDPYIDRWENYRNKMQGILDRSGTALVKSRNIRLKGLELAAHIEDIDLRIHITRCLKVKHGGRMALLRMRGDVHPRQA